MSSGIVTATDVYDDPTQLDPLDTRNALLAYGLFATLPLYLLVGQYAGLICNFITFVYPAFATVGAVRSTSQAQRDDDIQWLVYWTVYGIFAILDHVPFRMAENVQLYWLFKAVEPWVVKVEKLIERPKKEKDVVSKGKEKEVPSKGVKEVVSKGGKEVASKGSKSKNK
uniref:Receptor expression-enhancing protein n=1 Tax=Meloidogyne javanica TaxID=6303 RepID=A0A915N2W6_MELJA